MFYNKKGTDAEALGRLVEYVRKNVQHLETYTTDHLLYNSGKLSWLPFKEEEEETAKEEGVDKEWFTEQTWKELLDIDIWN